MSCSSPVASFARVISSGNSFLVREDMGLLQKEAVSYYCKKYGVDGLVLLRRAKGKPYAYSWKFYNDDGSNSNICGNASKAVSLYAYTTGLVRERSFSFLSDGGIIEVEVLEVEAVKSEVLEVEEKTNKTIEKKIDSTLPILSKMDKAIKADKSKAGLAREKEAGLARRELASIAPARGLVRVRFPLPGLIGRVRELGSDFYYIDAIIPHLCSNTLIKDIGEIDSALLASLEALRHRYGANVTLSYEIQASHPAIDASRGDKDMQGTDSAPFRGIFSATFERGCERITLGCGSGCVASFYLYHLLGLEGRASVATPSGHINTLEVMGNYVMLVGEARVLGASERLDEV